MIILGIHTGHDAGACLFDGHQLLAFCKEERLTRVKNDGNRFKLAAVDEVLGIGGIRRDEVDAVIFTRMRFPLSVYSGVAVKTRLQDLSRRVRNISKGVSLIREMKKRSVIDENEIIDLRKLRKAMGVRQDVDIRFVNHHFSHVLCSYKYTTWEEDALFISCDAGGDGAYYSAYAFDGSSFQRLIGGDDLLLKPQPQAASIGVAYSMVTALLGYTVNRHEGKITGLAAFGKPVVASEIANAFTLEKDGSIATGFATAGELRTFIAALIKPLSREDAAASIQSAAERVMLGWVKILLKRFPAKYIGMSGGVFSNVLLNQKVAELPGVDEVFVFPAMGDEGLPVGNCAAYLVEKYGWDGVVRDQLGDVYLGRPYTGSDLFSAAKNQDFTIHSTNAPAVETARLLADGWVGAIFSQRMEMGPRALGARSIIASPVKKEINDSLNKRLERTEFMPFAPYVLAEDAETVFDISDKNREACNYMTITTFVHAEYQEKIPAVVHVDGTARPQVIKRETNPLYYDILKEFKGITGLPCLVNTSFNAHEEPIINTPSEALQALRDNRIDFLVCDNGLIFVADSAIDSTFDDSSHGNAGVHEGR